MSISESSNRRSSEEKWVAAYYPNLAIEKPRSKAMLCLLFDKVICHFPITDMAHGGGSGMSENFGNDPLVEAGVIELREELLLPEIETNFSPGHYWGTDEEFDKYVCLQVTSMALNVCLDCGAVPVTDRDDWPIPAAIMDKVDLPRFAKLHGVALALQSLDIAIPISTDISSEDILEARDRLGEQLVPFRRAMLSLAPLVRQGIEANSSINEVHKEAKYIVETRIAPTIFDIRDRISKEISRFWRRLILKGGMIAPKIILNWVTKDTLTAAISSLEAAQDVALDIFDRKALLSSLKDPRRIGILIELR